MKFNFKASWQVNANMCRNIKLINGGSFYQGEKEIIFYNTCSIDYFLLVCHLVYSKLKIHLLNRPDKPFLLLIKNISSNLINNDWNKVLN